ncbi:hypothetical protein [Natronomonas gomsonensis]|uniref:hypothetical protein n=1 Tax=Natronomonas gomsonensis TaxID=1046043 RepID=UPI0015C1022C|nr:hypothetical protein [Natronomonas gomsonensis]
MDPTPNRRALLVAAGATAAALAGCTDTLPGSDTRELPESCPTSQDLDVEWPRDLDSEAVASFLEAYEHVYYREEVVEYEPESRVDSYGLSVGVSEDPTTVDGGYEATLSGSGGIYRPTLNVGARTADAPDDADIVSIEEVDDETLREVLQEAAESGEAEHHIEPPGEEVDRYIELVASLSSDFEPPSAPGESGTAYFDVDGTTVELTLHANRFHGDYWWKARYYVDENVVWRVEVPGEEPPDPRAEGKLLECREDA